MIHRLLLDPQPSDGGAPVAPPAAPAKPTVPQAVVQKPAPSPAGKADFKIDTSVFAPDIIKDFKVEQLPPVKTTPTPAETKTTDLTNKPLVEPEKKVEAAKAPEKVVDKPVVEAAPAEEPKKSLTDGPIQVQKTETGGTKHFDYTGYTEQEQVVLKNMSSQSREVVSKLMRENKDLAKLKDATYLQHPQAYVLSPEFKELQDNAYYANREAVHWEQQLAAIKAGQEWQPITHWDKNGNPVLGPAQKPDGNVEERVRQAMMKCSSLAQKYEADAANLQNTYTQRVQQDSAGIQSLRAKSFSWAADPTKLEDKIDIGNGNEKSVKQIREDFISVWPPYLRNTPGVEIAADCFAGIQIYAQALRALESEKKVAELKVAEVRRAEPSSNNRPMTPGASANGKMFTLEGLPR